MHPVEGLDSAMMGEDAVTMVVEGALVEGISTPDLISEAEVVVGEDIQIVEPKSDTRGLIIWDQAAVVEAILARQALVHLPKTERKGVH